MSDNSYILIDNYDHKEEASFVTYAFVFKESTLVDIKANILLAVVLMDSPTFLASYFNYPLVIL